MCCTCIIAFTGGLVGSGNPVQHSSPAIQSSDPVHNPVQRLETTGGLQVISVTSLRVIACIVSLKTISEVQIERLQNLHAVAIG